jgi:hypothetical protein
MVMPDRINLLTAIVRGQSGKVIWIRHCGRTGDGFTRFAARVPSRAGENGLREIRRTVAIPGPWFRG